MTGLPDSPSLRITRLHKSFDGVTALAGLSLEVEQGSCTAVLGPSGCGKSTLLRIIAGLEPADEGRVEVGGRVTDDPASRVPPERRDVALVFQDLALWPHMDVRRNLEFVLNARRIPKSEFAARVDAAIEAVGFPVDLLSRRPGLLSGGERQRAAVARALIQEPSVLLLDEPLTGLDRDLRVRLLTTLRRLREREGLSVLVVTHDQEEAFALADRVAVVRAGVVEQFGTPQEVYERPASRFVAEFVGVATCLPVARNGGNLETVLGAWPVEDAPGGPLVAVFRADALALGKGPGARRGRVLDAFFQGDRWMHSVRLEGNDGGADVWVRAPESHPRGAEVGIEADRPAFVPQGEDPPRGSGAGS